MAQDVPEAVQAGSGEVAGAVRHRTSPLQRVGVCLFLATALFGVAALGGSYLGGQAEWGASIDGSHVAGGSAARFARFEVHSSVVALALLMAISISNLAYGACSSSSSGSFSRKCAALLLICCVIGAELPSAEALSRPVIDGEGVLRSPLVFAYKGSASLQSNDSATAAGPETSSRHLLSLEEEVQRQMPTELLEMNGFTDEDMSPTPPEAFMKQEESVERASKEMSKELKSSKKRQEAMEMRVKKLDQMIGDQLSNVATSVQQENERLTNEIIEVPPVHGPPGPQGLPGDDGAAGKNGKRENPRRLPLSSIILSWKTGLCAWYFFF